MKKDRNIYSRENGVVKKILYSIAKLGVCFLRAYSIKFTISRMREKSIRYQKIEDYVEFLFNFNIGVSFNLNIRPVQKKSEIIRLIKLLETLRPKLVLEVGTAGGGTLFLVSKVSDPSATLISIDLPFKHGGYPEWKIPLYQSFASAQQKIHLLKMDSHSESTLKAVERILSHHKLDFLFIDGDHSYNGVKRDFQMYNKLVRKGGIIAFHDILPDFWTRYNINTGSNAGQVYQFWNEIKDNYNAYEIIEDPNQDGCGIGILKI